jgi:FkbM family methyltransferase
MAATTLYQKCAEKGLTIRHVCEVGVYTPERSNVLEFITRDKLRATLVEPDPQRIAAIKKYFAAYPGVTLIPYAVYDHNGTLELAQRGESTFATALPFSPAVINDQYQVKKEDTFSVPCKRFDEMDDGSIDLLHIDTEGCEWYVLKYLKSRPLVISLETHGKSYSNPYLKEILDWMERNGYQRWCVGRSDSIFRRDGAFEITAAEKRRLFRMGLYLRFRKFRKGLFRKS